MSLSQDLADLLNAEREIIRAGDYGALESLLERKSQLFAALSDAKTDTDVLSQLKDRAERNAALLEAAHRGFGAALSQIAQARTAATPRTYGPDGARDTLGPSGSRIEKRC